MASQDYYYYSSKAANSYGGYSNKSQQQKRKFFPNKRNNKKPQTQSFQPQFQQSNTNNQSRLADNHEPNLTCFQKCTLFNLSINAQGNNNNMNWTKNRNKTQLEGRVTFIKFKSLSQAYPGLKFEENIIKCLPIDMNEHQRFALNPKIPKLPLFIQFDISDSQNDFNNFGKEYLINTFEIELNAQCHDLKVFKNSIKFAAKGFDICKGIVYAANSYSISQDSPSFPNKSNSRVFEIEASIWKSQQISFSVFFTINLGTLKKINFSYMNSMNNAQVIQSCLFNSEVKISKIFLKYYLPLTAFYAQNQAPLVVPKKMPNNVSTVPVVNNPNFSNPMVPFQQQINLSTLTHAFNTLQMNQNLTNSFNNYNCQPKLSNTSMASFNQILSSNYNNYNHPNQNLLSFVTRIQQGSQLNYGSSFNYSNFHIFMTCTTPVIFETEDLTIKDIFNAFYKPSLFGINCLYKLNSNIFTKVKYRPFLNTVFLELQEGSLNVHDISGCFPSNMTANTDNSSSLDNSFTNVSCGFDEKKSFATSDSGHNFICLKGSDAPLYQRENLFEQVRNLFNENPYAEDLKLKDIKEGSYFSVIYPPVKVAQPKSTPNLNFIECEKHSIFEVFYLFRHNKISNKGQHLKVIGIRERDKKGYIINSVFDRYFDYFWFINRSVENNSNQVYYFEQDLNSNRQLYLSYVQNIMNVGNIN